MAKCPNCGSENCYGYSRVVGYFSRINNWNKGKIAEHNDRVKGNYEINQEEIEMAKEQEQLTWINLPWYVKFAVIYSAIQFTLFVLIWISYLS